MENVMIIQRGFSKAMAMALASIAAVGCASTQTAAFQHMSAEDHERAGSAAAGSPLAAHHLAAARDLRRSEQAACLGVPDADRDSGPFARRDQIAGVQVLRDRLFPKAPEQPVGVAVYLRAAPGMSEEWIGRVIECNLAHQAVVGARTAEQTCPLTVDNSRIELSSTRDGYRVAITSKDGAVARSLIERCASLSD
jgi:hypothetical protein